MATYFGTGLHADVLGAGLRLPNVLQNLLGEGTLSASFIPVYSELLGQGRTKEAGRVAGAMFGLLLAVAGTIALLGILLAPLLVDVFLPGFEDQRRELMIEIVRILFPMTGVLVLSAWALGILNSHRHFFLPYFAPVLWNAAIIGALVAFAGRLDLDALLMAAAWGGLAGGLLQFLVQLPAVLRLDREIRIGHGRDLPPFQEALRNAGPAILGRGVVQLSSYIDLFLGSLLAIGAVARLRYAQTLYVLPVSLFGASTAAAELPELARERSGDHEALRTRVVAAVRRVSFFVVPSFVAFVLLGDVLVAGIYRAGAFGAGDVTIVWLTLAAYGFGLLASTTTRVYQSAFFALRDTKTPARVAALRMVASADRRLRVDAAVRADRARRDNSSRRHLLALADSRRTARTRRPRGRRHARRVARVDAAAREPREAYRRLRRRSLAARKDVRRGARRDGGGLCREARRVGPRTRCSSR